MAGGILLKSVAKEVLGDLPNAKPEGLANTLTKKGVKPEELKFMDAGLDHETLTKAANYLDGVADSKGRITSEYLKKRESTRKDEFGESIVQGNDSHYDNVIPELAEERMKPNSYKERIVTFKRNDGKMSSEHYPDEPNYLMHTRMYDELVGDADTRVVAEIQSDLHQNGLTEVPEVPKVASFLRGTLDQTELNKPARDSSGPVSTFGSAITRMEYGLTTDYVADFTRKAKVLRQEFDNVSSELPAGSTVNDVMIAMEERGIFAANELDSSIVQEPQIKQAPWKSSWMRKGLENEVLNAIKDGKQQLAIPIKDVKSGTQIDYADVDFSPALDYLASVADPAKLTVAQRIEFRKQVNEIELSLPGGTDGYLEYPADVFLDNFTDGRHTANATDFVDTIGMLNMGSEFDQPESMLASMARSEGVQKWYETSVEPTARKLAKQLGAGYKLHDENGIQYALLELGNATKPASSLNTKGLTLYAGGGPLAVYSAIQAGYKPDDIRAEMLEAGLTEEEVGYALSQYDSIATAKENDYTDEEIEAFYESEYPAQGSEETADKGLDGNPYVPDPAGADEAVDKSFAQLIADKPISLQELSTALHTVYPDMSSITTRLAAFTGDSDAAIRAQKTEEAAVARIKQGFESRNVSAEFIEGEWYVYTDRTDPDSLVRVTPGMWDSFWAARGETIGAVAGGIAGGRAGLAAAPPTPWSKAAGVVLGSAGGAVLGSVIGTELDYLRDSIVLSEDLSAEVSAHKALTAAEASVIGDLVGLGVFKAGAGTWKAVTSVKDMLVGGNTEGARRALRDTMFLTEDEINNSVTQLAKAIDTSTMSQAQQEITATALLQPGAQDLVKAAGVIDPTASRAVIRSINDRAADVLATTSNLAGEGVPQKLYEDLNAYVQQTKDFYGSVKLQAATAPRAKYYKFNIDKNAIEPVFAQLQANIQDPAMLEKFVLQVNKARMHTNGRTFEDLIELRQLVNDFAFNRKITNAKTSSTLRTVISNLDDRIEAGSNFVFGKQESAAWRKDFTAAKLEYSKMKSLERNSLTKLVRRPGVQPDLIAKALLRYSNSVDGTYEQVLTALPPKTRVNVEGTMINDLAEKYSAGEANGLRATNFPMLSSALDGIQLLTPEARKIKAGLKELSEVFRNDIPLSQSMGMLTIPKFQSYLTADPVVRAKFAAASSVFNYVKTLVPGSEGRQAALLRNTAKFLETPLNAKALKAFADEVGSDINLGKEILEIQKQQGEAIAKSMDPSAPRIKFYGNGKILTTSGKGAEHSIPRHRVASKVQASNLAAQNSVSTDNEKALDLILSKYGFKAVEYGSDKVRLLRN